MGLADIKIVLVDPLYGGNIGAAARALATMGLRRLCLVRPNEFPSKQATMLAAHAQPLLDAAQRCAGLDEAIADRTLVVGTSARNRRLGSEVRDLRAGARVIMTAAQQANSRIAILFGSEDRGLQNVALARCGMHLFIHADRAYPSLNLAAAVQLVCYELRCAAMVDQSLPAQFDNPKHASPRADDARLEHFYGHLERWLHMIRFFNPQNPVTIMRKMRHIFNRARLRANEVEMLRGLITNSMRTIKQSERQEH